MPVSATQANVPRCHIPWQQMVVDSTGAAAPCCYWGAYDNINPPVGNVKEQSIEEIWNGEPYQKLRAAMARGDLEAAGCKNCYALKQNLDLAFEYDPESNNETETPYAQNIRTLKAEIASGATVLKAKPTIVSYIPSHRCNIRCTHCYQEGTRDAEINRADAAEEIERLAPYLVRLVAGGGEPFLLPIWRRFLASFDLGVNPYLDFSTSTNATIISNSVMAGLSRFKRLTINISLDGTGEVYERVRQGANFEQVATNIRRLREVVQSTRSPGSYMGVSMCVMKSNIKGLADFVRFCTEEQLAFGMSPVVTMPPDESLRCFNDPAAEMDGWSQAIDDGLAAQEDYFPVWDKFQEGAEELREIRRSHFQMIRDMIPFHLVEVPHRRITFGIPKELLREASAAHKGSPLVAYIYHVGAAEGATYWGPIVDGECKVSLPDGDFALNVSTKWVLPGYRDDFKFTVSARSSQVSVSRETNRYTPRRIAMGVFRRTKRMVGSLVG